MVRPRRRRRRRTVSTPRIEKVLQPSAGAPSPSRSGSAEAEKTRQGYVNGLAAATQIAQVSFLSQFPELASIAPENLPESRSN